MSWNHGGTEPQRQSRRTYENSDTLYQKILAMKEEDAAKVGISARTLYYWKAQTRECSKIVLNDKVKDKMT